MIAGLGIVLFGAAFGTQQLLHWKRGDNRPTLAFSDAQKAHSQQDHAEMTPPIEDAELDVLRAEASKDPKNVELLKRVSARMRELLRGKETVPPAFALEAIDVLSAILKLSPNDTESLVFIADLSFDQKAFDKAAEFYRRYLGLVPEDNGARSRYASTLTFMKKYDDALGELGTVLAKDPGNFPAKAYLAITYAEKGDRDKALETGNEALKIAPSEEARARFQGFIYSLQGSGERGTAASSDPVSDHVKNHPIAGSKFVRSDRGTDGRLVIYLKDFPMEMMPPMPKEKFLNGLKEKRQGTGIGAIVLIDEPSGKEMARVE